MGYKVSLVIRTQIDRIDIDGGERKKNMKTKWWKMRQLTINAIIDSKTQNSIWLIDLYLNGNQE